MPATATLHRCRCGGRAAYGDGLCAGCIADALVMSTISAGSASNSGTSANLFEQRVSDPARPESLQMAGQNAGGFETRASQGGVSH